MPGAVRKAEARSQAPDPVSQVAANLEARVDCDLGGRKRRGGSGRHGQLTAEGTGFGRSPGLVVLCRCSRAHQPTRGLLKSQLNGTGGRRAAVRERARRLPHWFGACAWFAHNTYDTFQHIGRHARGRTRVCARTGDMGESVISVIVRSPVGTPGWFAGRASQEAAMHRGRRMGD
jgi:hypothetical protein